MYKTSRSILNLILISRHPSFEERSDVSREWWSEMERRTFRNETSSPLFSFFGPSASSSSFSFFLRYNHFSLGLTCSSVCFTSLNGRIIDLESEKGSAGVNQLCYVLKEEFFSKYFSLVIDSFIFLLIH